MQTITDEVFAHGLRTYIKAGFADELTDGLIDALLEPRGVDRVADLAGRAALDGRRDRPRAARRHRVPVPRRALADQHPRDLARRRPTTSARSPGRVTPTPRSSRYLSDGTYVNFMDEDDDAAADAYGAHARAPAAGQGDLRPGERLPPQPEHHAGERVLRDERPRAEVQRRLWGTDSARVGRPRRAAQPAAVRGGARRGRGRRRARGCSTSAAAAGSRSCWRASAARSRRHRRQPRPARRSRASGCPDADLREGDMETLPFDDEAFDAVLGVNALPVRRRPAPARCARRRASCARRARRGQPVRGARALAGHGAPRRDVGADPARARRPTTRPTRCRRPATSSARWSDAGLRVVGGARCGARGTTRRWTTRCAACSAPPAAPAPMRGGGRGRGARGARARRWRRSRTRRRRQHGQHVPMGRRCR